MLDLPGLAYDAFQVMMKYEDEFNTYDDIHDKLKYVEGKLKENNIRVDKVVDLWKRNSDVQVDCLKSKEFRNEGNKLYKKNSLVRRPSYIGNLFCILYSRLFFVFRKALSHFPGSFWEDKSNREEFGLALGNLSTANYEEKNYFDSSKCRGCSLENMSAEKISKFTERSDQCSKFLIPKQSIAKDQILPSYESDNFDIVYEEDLGRNGVASNDISFGDVILIDEPVVSTSKAGRQFCTNCLKKINSKEIYKSPLNEEVRVKMVVHINIIYELFRLVFAL